MSQHPTTGTTTGEGELKGPAPRTEPIRQSTKSHKKARASKEPTFFSILRDTAFFIGIYAYFAGWVYIFYYYQDFNTPLSKLDIPAYYFMVYAFSALYNFWGALIVLLALSLLIFFNERRRPHRILVSFILLALFPVLFWRAKTAAADDAYEDRFSTNNDRIALFFKGDVKGNYPTDLMANNDAYKLRLLAETKDSVIVFYQPPNDSGATPFLIVYDISRNDLTAAKKLVAGERNPNAATN